MGQTGCCRHDRRLPRIFRHVPPCYMKPFPLNSGRQRTQLLPGEGERKERRGDPFSSKISRQVCLLLNFGVEEEEEEGHFPPFLPSFIISSLLLLFSLGGGGGGGRSGAQLKQPGRASLGSLPYLTANGRDLTSQVMITK